MKIKGKIEGFLRYLIKKKSKFLYWSHYVNQALDKNNIKKTLLLLPSYAVLNHISLCN